jgi:hypothetical protein
VKRCDSGVGRAMEAFSAIRELPVSRETVEASGVDWPVGAPAPRLSRIHVNDAARASAESFT